MESLYYSAPRPFNKFPRGYRPVREDFSRRLRPSSSWSSLPLIADGRTPSLVNSVCASPVSPGYWPEERRPLFSETPPEPVSFSNEFSPRELSPLSTASDVYYPDMTRSVRSPPQHGYPHPGGYDYRNNTLRDSYQGMRSRDQSLERRPFYNEQPQTPQSQSHWQNDAVPAQMTISMLDDERRFPSFPPRKTQSDFSYEYLPINQDERAATLPPPQPTYEKNYENVVYPQRQLDGYFRRSLIEPTWMTNPPPPKAFNDIYARNSNPSSPPTSNGWGTRNSNTTQPSVIAASIPLAHNRVLHLLPNGSPQERTFSPEQYQSTRSRETPDSYAQEQRAPMKMPTDFYKEQPRHVKQPTPSDYYQGPIKPARSTFEAYPESDYQPQKEIYVDVNSNTHNKPPPNRERVERIFSPVESKIYNRSTPTVINGFTSHAAPVEDRHVGHHDADKTAAMKRGCVPPIAVIEPRQTGYNKFANGAKATQNKFNMPAPQRNSNSHLSQYSSANNLSPVSNYDNDSDVEVDLPNNRFATANLSRRNEPLTKRSHMYGENLHGILVKRPSTHKPSKKVVFSDQRRGSAPAEPSEAPPHVRTYDDAMESAISRWVQLSDQIGGDVGNMKTRVLNVFDALRTFLWSAAGQAEPAADQQKKLAQPLIDLLMDIGQFKDTKRNTPQFNHLSAVAEGIPAVGWVLIKKTPAPYVKEMIDAAMFYINRILKEFKDTDPKQVEWARAWKELLEEMQKFVRQTHTTGLVWNSAPGSSPGPSKSAPAGPPAPKAGGGAPPPPPPPLPADLFANMPKAPPPSNDKTNRDALFAELNKGEAITSGLKKVTADMQTHKNPNLRGTALTPGGVAKGAPGSSPSKAPVQKPPKIELQDGKQWNIEFQVGNPNIEIKVNDKKQTIYVYRCENSVIKVNGKANSITLDGCKKTSIVFDSVVGQCETINCQSVQIQTLGEMPTLSIQKTDGCQVYLSQASIGAEIVTSKSSEMNILIPQGEDQDFVEHAVPEQFKSSFVKGKLVTTVSEIV